MTYTGTIRIEKEGEASKSEGLYAYLDTTKETYRLFRDGVFPINDTFFQPFSGMTVDVEGEANEQWLAAKSITVWCCAEGSSNVPGKENGNNDNKDKKDNNEDNEKDMQ